MTITDPTALHSPKRSIASKATQWTIDTLQAASVVSWNPAWPAVNGRDMRNGNVNRVAAWICNKFY